METTCGYNTEESSSNSVSENHVMFTWAQLLTVMVNAQVRSSHFRLVTAFSAWNVWKSVPRITRNDSAFSMTCTGVSTLSLTWCHVSYVYHRALNGALHNYRYHWRNTVQDPTTWNGYGFVKNSTIKKEILKMKSFCSFSTIKRKLKGKTTPSKIWLINCKKLTLIFNICNILYRYRDPSNAPKSTLTNTYFHTVIWPARPSF